MELSGKVVQILPLVTGSGKNGEWKKQEFIVEIPGKYTKQVCVSLWGEKIDEARITEGEEIKLGIDIQSREYNGRWYTEVRAWKVEKPGAQDPGPDSQFIDVPADEEEDDLPF